MPDLTDDEIDSIAHGIEQADPEGPEGRHWDHIYSDFGDEGAVWREEYHDAYRTMARAALASMPQPVGYGVKTENSGWYGPHRSLRHAQKVAGFYGGNVTVVALVPVEDQ